MTKEPLVVTEKDYPSHFHYRICWSAIFAGSIVGLGLAFLLHMYGLAIGLSAYSASDTGATAIAMGGLLGMLIGVIAAMATAGFVSGYLGRHHYYHLHGGIIYGFITWSLILLISAVAAGPIMHYVTLSEKSLSQTVITENVSGDTTKTTKASAVKLVKKGTPAPAEITTTQLAWSGWVVFALFFIGALSCCIGACYGMRCTREIE